jgi:hypothetical protein
MAASRFVEVSDKEISEIKTNSDQKNTKKTCEKILKQLFASGSVIIGEYSPRLRRIIVNCSGNENVLKRSWCEVYNMLIVKSGKKLGSPKSFRRCDKCNMPPFPPYGAILTLLQVTRTNISQFLNRYCIF